MSEPAAPAAPAAVVAADAVGELPTGLDLLDGAALAAALDGRDVALLGDGTFVIGREGVGGCFGCGPANEAGLRLRFRLLRDGRVATMVAVARHHCGVDGVVHGGIQATILDEVSGVAAQLALPAGGGRSPCVTADLALRFRRPVAQATVVTAVASATSVEGRSIHVEASIVGIDGAALTTATSRWVQLA